MCRLNSRYLSDDKKAMVFVLTDLWTSGEREASNNNEEWGAMWWGGSAAVGPWVGTYSQGVRKSTEEGEREWERPLQRDQHIPRWEGPKRKVEAGSGQVWMPSGAGATEGALISMFSDVLLGEEFTSIGQKLTQFHFPGLSSYCDDGIVHLREEYSGGAIWVAFWVCPGWGIGWQNEEVQGAGIHLVKLFLSDHTIF